MIACYCSLAGTAACRSCSNNPYADFPPTVRTSTVVTTDTTVLAPSTQPERIRGRWMPHIEKSREYIGTVLVNVTYDYWFCDICGYRVENGQPTYNFCPNCGAEMEGA